MTEEIKILNIDEDKCGTMVRLTTCHDCADARWTDLKTVMAILVQQYSDTEIQMAMEEVHRRGYELPDPNSRVRIKCNFTIPEDKKDRGD